MQKILIAEDDRFLAAAYNAKLNKAGYETMIASDGDHALEILKNFTPDLILLDLIMPNKNGFIVLENISKDPILSKIPIFVLTNLSQKEDEDRARQLGAKEFIVKTTIDPKGLLEKINQFLS